MKTPPSVIGLVFDLSQQQVLVVKRRDVPMWTFPGGGVEPGETPEAAITREIEEETGLKTKIERKAGEYTPLNKLTNHTYLFVCSPLEGTPQTSSETKEVQFAPLHHLPAPFFPLHTMWLEDALQNPFEVVKKPIHQVTYWAVFSYFIRHPLTVIRFLFSKCGFPINS